MSDSLKLMYPVVSRVADKLTAGQIFQILIAVDYGDDPRNLDFYDKIKTLFDHTSIEGVPKMHELTKQALTMVQEKKVDELFTSR